MIGRFRRLFRLDKGSADVTDGGRRRAAFSFREPLAELRAAGMSEAEAKAEAERRFGNLPATRDQLIGIDRSREDRAR